MKLKMINDECITPVVKRQEKTKNGIHRVMHFLGKNPKISIRLSHLHFQCLFFNMFKLYIPLYHRQQCAYGLVRFRHKIHLVSVENNVLAQNIRFGRHRRDCNTVLRSHQKYPVVSHKQNKCLNTVLSRGHWQLARGEQSSDLQERSQPAFYSDDWAAQLALVAVIFPLLPPGSVFSPPFSTFTSFSFLRSLTLFFFVRSHSITAH